MIIVIYNDEYDGEWFGVGASVEDTLGIIADTSGENVNDINPQRCRFFTANEVNFFKTVTWEMQ